MTRRDRLQGARLQALTRAAYGAAEGVAPWEVTGPEEGAAEACAVGSGAGAAYSSPVRAAPSQPDRAASPEPLDPPGSPGSPGSPVVDASGSTHASADGASAPARRSSPSRRPAQRTAHRPRRLVVRVAVALLVFVALVTTGVAVRSVLLATGTTILEADQPGGTDAGAEGSGEIAGDPWAEGATTAPGVLAATTPSTASAASPAPEIVVHVAGHVVSPGVVRLAPGARVQDALTAVGGALAEADLDAVNLARPVLDGEQVYVPAPGEETRVAPPGGPAAPASGATAAGGSAAGSSAAGLVNLNTAALAELDTLPGIGPSLAQRIVDWREAHGGFRDVVELQEVSGIGPVLLARLTPLVTV